VSRFGASLLHDVPPMVRATAGTIAPCPIVIAHRGASGYRPEHTLASYQLAIRLGADYIEPDLVSTGDGVLVARHDPEIGATTDVSVRPEFEGRHTTKLVDGLELTGWFVEDFTLQELKTLRAVERLPGVRPANTRYDRRFEIPTFDEVLELAAVEGRRRGVPVGVYPETKNPTYFDDLDLSLEEPLLRSLRVHDLDRPHAPVYLQSYEIGNLHRLAGMTALPLVQLIDVVGGPYDRTVAGTPLSFADMATPAGLRDIAEYATVLAPDKDQVMPRALDGSLLAPTTLVEDAHREGLLVHAYTLRDENAFLPADLWVGDGPGAKGDAFTEYELLLGLGVDGLFSDYTDTAVQARDWWQAQADL
jgi:glycerophosphoryl diester phosphodiesterase